MAGATQCYHIGGLAKRIDIGLSVFTILYVIRVLTPDFDIITRTQRAFSLETCFSNSDTDLGKYRLAMQDLRRYVGRFLLSQTRSLSFKG